MLHVLLLLLEIQTSQEKMLQCQRTPTATGKMAAGCAGCKPPVLRIVCIKQLIRPKTLLDFLHHQLPPPPPPSSIPPKANPTLIYDFATNHWACHVTGTTRLLGVDLRPPWRDNDGVYSPSCVHRLEELVQLLPDQPSNPQEELTLNQRLQAASPPLSVSYATTWTDRCDWPRASAEGNDRVPAAAELGQ